jgi:hypothetical protein
MVLDGVGDPVAYSKGTAPWLASSIGSVDREFDAFLSLCQSAGPDRCARAGDVPAVHSARRRLADLRRSCLQARRRPRRAG